MKSLTELPRFRDRLSFLYLEKGRIEQHEKSVAFVNDAMRVPIPAADLALLMLGPGTTITHAAIDNLADCNCVVAWVGENGVRFYCHGRGGTHHSNNLLRQAELSCNPRLRREVVRRMYEKRFGETIDDKWNIQQVRCREGLRVRNAYQGMAHRFGVEWNGRNYDPLAWGSADPLNRALSAASACLNGVVHAGVVSAGYSPALGFVHTGKMLSFVYDIADLYKVDLIVPLVFELVADSPKDVERRARRACRDLFHRVKLLERMLPDVEEVLHGRDDTRTSSAKPARGSESLDDRAEGRDIPRPHDRPNP